MSRHLAWLVLFAAAPLCAEVYRWVDAEGRVHYSDRRPDAPARRVELPQAQAPDPAMQAERERGRRLLEVWEQERVAREQLAAEEAARRDEECTRLQAHLEQLERARRVVREDATGTARVLSDAERADYERSLRARFDERCG